MGEKTLNHLTLAALQLTTRANGRDLGVATGFIYRRGGSDFLVTNWHVLSGRNADTGKLLADSGAVPDELVVSFRAHPDARQVAPRTVLLDGTDGTPLWRSHSAGRSVDVAVLPLDAMVDSYPSDADHERSTHIIDDRLAEVDTFQGVGVETGAVLEVGMEVSVVGYPLGLTTGNVLPIWKTGHVASDPSVDHDGRPCFLIDATTRSGMSGALVIAHLRSYRTPGGLNVRPMEGPLQAWVGVYSGRLHDHAEIGIVWRPRVVAEIVDQIGQA